MGFLIATIGRVYAGYRKEKSSKIYRQVLQNDKQYDKFCLVWNKDASSEYGQVLVLNAHEERKRTEAYLEYEPVPKADVLRRSAAAREARAMLPGLPDEQSVERKDSALRKVSFKTKGGLNPRRR